MSAVVKFKSDSGNVREDDLFMRIAADIREKGYSINPVALPLDLADNLLKHVQALGQEHFNRAGIGREKDYIRNDFVRTDEVCWITGESPAGREWLAWAGRLQQFLNRQLLLGLFSFESHFAHYRPGDFYRRHVDAFKGEANRVLSLVVYLNPGWLPNDGGELVLYLDDAGTSGTAGADIRYEALKVTPAMATVVAFLSEEFPHEVLPASRDRYSIAGWYRVNTSTMHKIDPPR